jgi:hypothetical protein
MTDVILKRVSSGAQGTFGVLIMNDVPLCATLERNWDNNNPDTSCVPTGVYNCVRHNGDKFQGVWEVTGVPGREAILIHQGNSTKDTHGCILVGRVFMPFGVGLSQLALDDLRADLPENFTLTIKE